MQTRRDSVIEVLTNTFVGMAGSFVISLTVLHAIEDRAIAAGVTTVACTVWSIARGYWIRRRFNRRPA